MEFFINDPNVPRLPPTETRIVNLRLEPYPDGHRLHVYIELTPFQQRPYIELSLSDPLGKPCGSASIIEPVAWKLELNMHLRQVEPVPGEYKLTASLTFPEMEEVDRREVTFVLPPEEHA